LKTDADHLHVVTDVFEPGGQLPAASMAIRDCLVMKFQRHQADKLGYLIIPHIGDSFGEALEVAIPVHDMIGMIHEIAPRKFGVPDGIFTHNRSI
jgi:hypothetical protein